MTDKILCKLVLSARHDPKCPHVDSRESITDTDCYCYERHIYNAGRADALKHLQEPAPFPAPPSMGALPPAAPNHPRPRHLGPSMPSKSELIEAIRSMDDAHWVRGLEDAGFYHMAYNLHLVRQGSSVRPTALQELHDQMERVVRYRDA